MADKDTKPAEKPLDNSAEFKPMPAPDYVPVVMLVSEAGMGLRRDEIRGVSPEIAEQLIETKFARKPTAEELKTGKVKRKSDDE